jgi:CheY-like chemotaxis protein
MSSTEVFDSLRLHQAEVEQLIADLNRASAKAPGASKRALKRWPMQFQRCVLTTTSKMAGNVHGVAYPRNLCKKGAAVLSGSFVHPGTACHLSLRSIDGTARSIQGVVRWCRHVKARAHDLGIMFNAAINPRDFFIQQGDECLFQLEYVDVAALRGSLVVADADILTHKLFQDVLGSSAIEMTFAKSGAECLSILEQCPDLAIAEHALPDMTGLDLLIKAREAGHRTPIILMAQDTDKDLRLAAIGAGAKELLFRPATPETILRGVAEVLMPGQSVAGGDETNGSSPVKINCSAPLTALADLAREALTTMTSGDVEGGKKRLGRIATSCREFALPTLADQADKIAAAAGSGVPQTRLVGEIRGLLKEFESAATACSITPGDTGEKKG